MSALFNGSISPTTDTHAADEENIAYYLLSVPGHSSQIQWDMELQQLGRAATGRQGHESVADDKA